jgi:hypothetical protein
MNGQLDMEALAEEAHAQMQADTAKSFAKDAVTTHAGSEKEVLEQMIRINERFQARIKEFKFKSRDVEMMFTVFCRLCVQERIPITNKAEISIEVIYRWLEGTVRLLPMDRLFEAIVNVLGDDLSVHIGYNYEHFFLFVTGLCFLTRSDVLKLFFKTNKSRNADDMEKQELEKMIMTSHLEYLKEYDRKDMQAGTAELSGADKIAYDDIDSYCDEYDMVSFQRLLKLDRDYPHLFFPAFLKQQVRL